MPQRKQSSASTSRKVVRSAKTGFYAKKVTTWSKGKRVHAMARAAGQRAKEVAASSPMSEPGKVELPGFVGMLRSGRGDLAARAKEIVRGTDNPR